MLLNEPGRTNYDLSFSIFGFHVRVHPAFFILPVIFGIRDSGLDVNPGVAILVFGLVFFVSILVHELGHAFAFRNYGQPARIVLYWFGGLAIPDDGSWGRRGRSLSSNEQIVVSLAGPIAGFLLAAVFVGVVYAMGGHIEVFLGGLIPTLVPNLDATAFAGNHAVTLLLYFGIWANVFWNVLNLAPVFPLDGGQVSRQLFLQFDPWNGIRNSLMVAVIVGGLIGVLGIARGDRMMGILFLLLAYSNYMALQQMNWRGGGGRPW